LRIVIIAPHFPEYASCYSNSMSRRADVLLIADYLQFHDEFAGRDEGPTGAVKVRLLSFKTPLDLLRIVVATVRFCPDFVHLQEAVGPRRRFFNLVVGLFMKMTAIVVLTVHDPVPHEGRDYREDNRSRFLALCLRRIADGVVVHGSYCRNLYLRHSWSSSQRVFSSHHGVILQPHRIRIRAADLDREEIRPARFLMFGRMEAYKGLDVLSKAIVEQVLNDVLFELVIAGSGPELDRLESTLSDVPGVNVRNHYIPPKELIAELERADCVLLPYTSATQSGVLAAAFGAGCFVIASDVGGLSDVVIEGKNGFLIYPRDEGALAIAMARIARDARLREELSRGAIHMAESALSWDNIASQMATDMQTIDRTPPLSLKMVEIAWTAVRRIAGRFDV
jgi:glycosyltransferase involved in cell wall biosynthesis